MAAYETCLVHCLQVGILVVNCSLFNPCDPPLPAYMRTILVSCSLYAPYQVTFLLKSECQAVTLACLVYIALYLAFVLIR